MWGHRPRLDDDGTDSSDDESNLATEHKRVKSDTDGGFLVRTRAIHCIVPFFVFSSLELSRFPSCCVVLCYFVFIWQQGERCCMAGGGRCVCVGWGSGGGEFQCKIFTSTTAVRVGFSVYWYHSEIAQDSTVW